MKVGFTGTRTGMSLHQISRLRDLLLIGDPEFHHGDCVGADAQAAGIAHELGIPVIIHPPDIDGFRAFTEKKGDISREPKPYLVRNHDIVDETEILIAAPRSDYMTQRSGTWATVRYARAMRKKVILLRR